MLTAPSEFMGKKGLIFYSEEALGHLDRIAAFLIERASVNIAEEITDDLLDRMDILAEMPYLGHQHPDPVLANRGYRILICGQYAGVYLVTDDGIWVAGVFHMATDYLATLK